MMEINKKIYENAICNGITQKHFEFMAFKIKDLDKDFVQDREERRADLVKKYEKENLDKIMKTAKKRN